MSEPKVVWTQKDGSVGCYRIAHTTKHKQPFAVEKRHPNDAMGGECWQWVSLHGGWLADLICDLLIPTEKGDSDEAGTTTQD